MSISEKYGFIKGLSSRGERACNPHSANVDGEILIVTKNSKTFDEQASIGNVCTVL